MRRSWTETERLEALDRYGILDTPAEPSFDDLVRLASELLGAPIAAVNLVAAGRQWFKAEIGLGLREMPLDNSICAQVILRTGELVVPDLLLDPRFECNPLVTSGPKFRFYAGEILTTPEGLPLGTLCVMDFDPRPDGLTEQQLFVLQALARQVVGQLELRRALTQQARTEALQRQTILSVTDFAIISTDLERKVLGWNPGAVKFLGWSEEEMLGQSCDKIFIPEDQAARAPEAEATKAFRHGRALNERWHQRKDGSRFWGSGEMMQLRDEKGVHVGYVKVLRDRTEQHLAGQTMSALNERYRLASRATNDAIWDWNLRTGTIQWNEALQEAYGWTPEQVDPAGEWWLGAIHPDDRERVNRSIHAAIAQGSGWTDEYRFRRADGSYAEVLDRGFVIRDRDEQAVRMIGAMLDLTEIRKVEAALRASEERFRSIMEEVDAAFAIVQVKFDAADQPIDYRFVEANPGFERQAGVDLRGKWVTEFAPNLERFWFETYGHVAKTGERANFESYAEAFGRWFDVRAVRVGEPADRQIAIIFNDVTARKQSEDRLRVSEALARENVERVQLALSAGAIIGTWNWDLSSGRMTVDEAFARVFGLDQASGSAGIGLEQMLAPVHPDDQPGLRSAMKDATSRGGPYAHQYRVRRKDGGYRWIEASGRVDLALDGTPVSFPGILVDVEERRAIEAERDRAIAALRQLTETLEQQVTERTAELMHTEEQLRQSQKMEAVGQLTGGLAHDFNNLLTGITGSLDLLDIRVAQGRLNDLDRYISAAQGAAKRAATLTHRLLAFSRQQPLDPKPTDVNALVADMAELIRRTVGPQVTVEVVGAVGLWSTLVDAPQLENALLNLCINARDAMPNGGRITVETANKWLDERAAGERDLPAGQYLTLCVTDTGTGMTPDVIARAFDPFFTTKPLGQGTGLGLSMIYGFVRQSGGQVRISSELGQGTTMCLYLPRYDGDVAGPETHPVLADAPRAEAGETVLVVDDEPTIRMLVLEVLEGLGYLAIEAGDGASGLKILQSDARVDLLVTDIGLPGGMNGFQMASFARTVRPELKILFTTGYAENALIGNGVMEPGMHVLTKPFPMEALASRVKELIAAGR